MNAQNRTETLSDAELACLRHLLTYPDVELPQFEVELIEKLIALGLVEAVFIMVLPVLPQQRRYRLTDRGRAKLKDAAPPDLGN